MHANAKLDAAFDRHPRVALDEALLQLYRAAHGVDLAAEFDEAAVPRPLNYAPAMGGDGGIDQVAAEAPQPRQGAILVGASEPAVADDVRHQDRSNLPDFGHGRASRVMQYHKKGLSRASANQKGSAKGSPPPESQLG
jgi:hypothetical protein